MTKSDESEIPHYQSFHCECQARWQAARAEIDRQQAEMHRLFENGQGFRRRAEEAEVENERLRTRVVMLLRCHYEHDHHASAPTCFDVQSPADEWETKALANA